MSESAGRAIDVLYSSGCGSCGEATCTAAEREGSGVSSDIVRRGRT